MNALSLLFFVAALCLPVINAFSIIGASHHRGTQQRTSLHMLFGGNSLAAKLGSLVESIAGKAKITEDNIEDTLKEVKNILVDADVNLKVTNNIIKKVKERAIGMDVVANTKPGEQFMMLLAKELVDTMGSTVEPLSPRRTDGRPTVILMAGLQGAGKTTTVAKIAKWALKTDYSKKLMLVAADVYRPAAIDQLQILGQRLGVEVYTEGDTVSPVKICRNALQKGIKEGYDTIIIDTAGRQIVDDKLMDELRQIKSAVSPDETLLIVDAMSGQEAATFTQKFNEVIGITGTILTKMDGDSRGGSALSIRGVSGKPIKFCGVGEGLEDIEPFYPERMASRILGMGDLASLLEKAQGALNKEESMSITKKMQKGDFDFNDFLVQTQSMKKLGGVAGMMKMLPGAAGKVTDEMIFETEKRVRRAEKLISVMTDEERSSPDLLTQRGGKRELNDAALLRRADLAKRAELSDEDTEAFISEFISMKKLMQKNLKGIDIDASANSEDGSVQRVVGDDKRGRKGKASRGGGGGFGSKKA